MLTVSNLSYRVNGRALINNVSFSIQPGKLVGIIGANGAGKSTLMKLLSMELLPTNGCVTWNDRCIQSYAVEDLARVRAALRQSSATAHQFNVQEVVMMGRYPHFKSRPQLNDSIIVEDELDMAELDHLAFQPYQQLSGGEQQRVSMSRTLVQLKDMNGVRQAKCLLLDEPLNHLDIKYAHDLLSRVVSFVDQGNTAVVVLHDIQKAAHFCDEVIVLNGGEVYSEGTPDKVFTKKMMKDCFDVEAEIIPFKDQLIIHIASELSRTI